MAVVSLSSYVCEICGSSIILFNYTSWKPVAIVILSSIYLLETFGRSLHSLQFHKLEICGSIIQKLEISSNSLQRSMRETCGISLIPFKYTNWKPAPIVLLSSTCMWETCASILHSLHFHELETCGSSLHKLEIRGST